jgi:hypothetical protein
MLKITSNAIQGLKGDCLEFVGHTLIEICVVVTENVFHNECIFSKTSLVSGKISFCFAVGLAHRSQPFYLVPLFFVSSVKSLFDFITLFITLWLTNKNKDNILHSITIKISLLFWIPSGLAIRSDQVCQGILIKITINLYLTTMLQFFYPRYIPLNVRLFF